MNCCEAIDLMGDALEESLPALQRAGFEEHLQECVVCRTYLDQLRLTIQAVERLPRPELADKRRSELIAAFQRERGRRK